MRSRLTPAIFLLLTLIASSFIETAFSTALPQYQTDDSEKYYTAMYGRLIKIDDYLILGYPGVDGEFHFYVYKTDEGGDITLNFIREDTFYPYTAYHLKELSMGELQKFNDSCVIFPYGIKYYHGSYYRMNGIGIYNFKNGKYEKYDGDDSCACIKT
ncbi:MAG: hypothetical protein DRJ31_10385, partial [Candidatus Methanomethylicota archaeon]